MDDTLLVVLLPIAVVVAIPLSVGVVVFLYLRYRESLIRKRIREIELRKLAVEHRDTLTDATKHSLEIDYKSRWNQDCESKIQASLERDKIYEDELKRNELEALKNVIPKMPK